MTVTPSGSISNPAQYAVNLLASSATFRTLTGAADEDAAKAFIHMGDTIDCKDDEDPTEIVCPRPRGIVYPDEGQDDQRVGIGEWISTGIIGMDIELVIPTAYVIDWTEDSTATQKTKKQDASLWLWNQLGAIKGEMMTNSGGHDADDNPYLNATQITATIGPIPPRTDSGETWGMIHFSLAWV